MSIDPSKLREEVMRLPVDARARLAAELLTSLDDSPDEISPEEHDAAWDAELAERVRQVDSGEVKPVTWAEARKRIVREG
jgi:putative addiction module component (TIGR02574 family)